MKTLLVVDDEPVNLGVLRSILANDYRLLFARDGERALLLAREQHPDLILLDIMMPGMSGYDVCHELKSNPSTQGIPIIFVTALSDNEDEARGLNAGAVDYLTKPVSPAIVKARLRTHLSLIRLEELKRAQLAIVQRLGRAVEFKDGETSVHATRMSRVAQILARATDMPDDWVDNLVHAAPMHDIGKLAIPDSILQKPARLTPEEWAVMKTHSAIGAEILGENPGDILGMAARIARYHHEKWDGTGYPEGLAGTAIPLEARIVALADVFDALISDRPYKSAWTIEAAVEYIEKERGGHFDPGLVDAFLVCLPAILQSYDSSTPNA